MNIKKIVPYFFLLSLNIYSQNIHFINAQVKTYSENSSIGFTQNINSDFSSAVFVGKEFLLSPLHFDTDDLILTGIIVGTTTAASTLDNPIRNNIRGIHSNSLDNITSYGEKFGSTAYSVAIGGIIYFGGHIIGDNELRKTGLILTEAIFLNALVTEGLKIGFGRSRPYENEGNYDIDFMQMKLKNDELSFPSGHTSTAFAIATVLSQRIDNIYASIALYSAAGLTAFQRIYDDKHWFSDTVLGAALGTVIGLKVLKLNSEYEEKNSGIGMNITPMINSYSYGLNFTLNF